MNNMVYIYASHSRAICMNESLDLGTPVILPVYNDLLHIAPEQAAPFGHSRPTLI